MRSNHSKRFPLTASQRQMYAAQLLDPDSPLYNTVIINTLQGSLCEHTFRDAWNTVVSDNSALSIRLIEEDDEPLQSFSVLADTLQLIDFSGHPDPQASAEDWIEEAAHENFVLHEVLFRAALLKLSSDQWIWFCNQHHLITDALSFQSLWNQLGDCYLDNVQHPSDSARHVTPGSNSPDDQVGGFVDFLQAREAAGTAYPARRLVEDNPPTGLDNRPAALHWRQRSKGVPVSCYHGKRGQTTTRSIRVSTRFNASRTEALERLARIPEARSFNRDISTTTVLLAILYAFLHRVSGQNTLTIGSPTAYRSDPNYKASCGPYFEVLPLQIQIDDNDSFADVLKKSRAEIMAWMRYAGEDACEEAGQASISVVLNFIFASMHDLGDITVNTTWIHPNHADRHHALRLHVTDWQNTGTLDLSFDFNEAYFDSNLRQSAIGHWWMLFDAMSHDTDQRVANVNLHPDQLPAADTVSSSPTDSPASDSPFKGVTAFIDATTQKHAEASAVTQGKVAISFADLQRASCLIAAELIERGIGAGDRVCVCLHRSLNLPVVLLGVLKSGAAYVPAEPGFPAERIRFIVGDSAAALVISEASLTEKFESDTATLLVDRLLDNKGQWVKPGDCDETPLPDSIGSVTIEPQTPAYILYTSGSTGQPKGVVTSHAALANYCIWASDFYCSGKRLAFPLFTPLGFDLTVTSLFPPLISGGTVRVYPESTGSVDATLFSVLEDNAVDIVKLTPAHLALIKDQDFSSSRIRQLIVGGEDLKTSLASRVHNAFNNNVLIHNEYGPTEATVGCIVCTYQPDSTTSTSVPIGQAIAGMSAWVLNDALQLQPDGVMGELFLSGPSLAQGYWNRPELTDAAFLTSVSAIGSRCYRTGDLVRHLPDGQLLYLGRIDDQIKIRGVRIEPAEIEIALLSHPLVSACVVTPKIQSLTRDTKEYNCVKCGIASDVPDIRYNDEGVCNICEKFDQTRSRAFEYFKSMPELQLLADKMQTESSGQYDCMVLLSGGKDSTYALARMADMGLSVLAFTLDNGFISPEAKINITGVCESLKVDHMFGSTPHMNQIFADSLSRHSNVCHGCFKTIYTLSMQTAREKRIPYIVTGLSRGQFFETRLTEELFTSNHISIDNIDDAILSARKSYHKADDAVHRLLDVSQFDDETIFEQVKFIDFYRYCEVSLEEMLDFLTTRIPWIRPSDTGRSTNCLINDVGIYVHKKEQGFHNYSLPYSWDVRMGHKERDAALDELDDDIDEVHVHNILDEIGYSYQATEEAEDIRLAAYYVAKEALSAEKARDWLGDRLPSLMLPSLYTQIDEIPLSHNGKVDIAQLPEPSWARNLDRATYRAPRNALESALVELWQEHLKIEHLGIDENFFELGGDSLLAIRIIAQLNNLGYQLKPAQLFENQTIARLGRVYAGQPRTPLTAASTTKTEAFSTLKPGQRDKLDKLLNRKKS